MHKLSNNSGFDSSSEESWEAGDFKSSSENKQSYKELIVKANSVPLAHIFKYYGLDLSEQNRKINCPFSAKHKNGADRTPSFEFFPHTNTFYCHGCKTNNRGCNFVSNIENISVYQAAFKILELYESEATFDGDFDYKIDYSERLEILIEFSDFVRDFIQAHINEVECRLYIENIAKVLDHMLAKKKIDNQNLINFIGLLKTRVSTYKKCPQF